MQITKLLFTMAAAAPSSGNQVSSSTNEVGSFLLSIFASIIATLICLWVSAVFSQKWRRLYYFITDFVLKTGIAFFYPNRTKAEIDIEKDIKNTKKLKFMGGRGEIIKNPPYNEILSDTTKDVKILLPVPDENNIWVIHRVEELKAANKVKQDFTSKSLVADIKAVITHYCKSKVFLDGKLRYFDSMHLGRIIITDEYAYLTLYEKDKVGKYSPLIKYFKNSPMYMWIERYFDGLYNTSVEACKYSGSLSKETEG